MKRLKFLLITACVLLLFTLTLISCGECVHDYDNECDTVCNKCEAEREVGDHLWTTPDIDACSVRASCTLCGLGEGETVLHSYDNDCDSSCNGCGKTRDVSHNPNADDGDCTTAITCINCDYVFTEPKEHVYNDFFNANDLAHWYYCSNEGCISQKDYSEHYGEDDGDCTTSVSCDTCGWTHIKAMESHDLDESYTCTVCGTCTMESSVLVNGEKTYFENLYEAVSYAQSQEGCVVALENNCSLTADFPIDVTDGKFTIDLNGKAIGKTSISLYVSGGDVTVIDSKGGGSARNIQVQGGKLTIESGTFGNLIATKGTTSSTVIIRGGIFSSVSANDKDASLTISGGSFEAITCFNFQFSPDDFLADGYAYYDSEGNVLDEYILDSTIYRLSNVTVGKIAE